MSLTAAAAAAIGAPPSSAPQLEAASSLPFPVSFHSRPAYHKHDTSPSRAFVGTTTTAATRGAAAALGFIGHNIASRPLTARSRATRLAVWLLGATLAVSVLLNIRFLVWDDHRGFRWPMDKFEYIGIDNEGDTTADYEGERKYGLEPYRLDRYGCHGRLLAKRRKRNPFRRFHGYHSSAPELKDLFEYCPLDNKLFAGPLPWDH